MIDCWARRLLEVAFRWRIFIAHCNGISPPTPTHAMIRRGDNSNRRLLSRLGESTSNILSFDDIRRPELRKQRSLSQRVVVKKPSKPTLKAAPSFDIPTEMIPTEICFIPESRGVIKSFSSPPVLSPREDEIEWQRSTIEVTPGYYLPLCGALETMYAFQKDFVIHAECAYCDSFLYCIDTAVMVLCPSCRSISPLPRNSVSAGMATGSIGLGLTVEHVFEE